MQVFRGYHAIERTPPHAVVTIGNFDGVHLGHRKILEAAVSQARKRGGTAVAYTFRPHPQLALRPDADVKLLCTYDEKLELIERIGIDWVIEEPFSREFSTTEPEAFFSEVLIRRLGAEAVVVGYDFAFGRGREGHLQNLELFCRRSGVPLTVIPPQRAGSDVVSSTRIRQQLLAGDVPAANQLLGRRFFYRGIVIRGEGRGRKLGFPTANLKIENKLALPHGVYATWAKLGDRFIPSVTNVGVRPTFEKSDKELAALVETHLIDFAEDLYGQILEVQFLARLRAERKFAGIEPLKAQIRNDLEQARAVLGAALP